MTVLARFAAVLQIGDALVQRHQLGTQDRHLLGEATCLLLHLTQFPGEMKGDSEQQQDGRTEEQV